MTSGAPLTSLARPSGNITGVFPQQIELAKKRLQIFKEALPDLQTSTMFWDASSEDQWKATSATAGEFGLRLVGVELLGERPYDYEAALMQAPLDHSGALITPTSPAFYRDRERLAELALRHRIASIFGFREWVEAGWLAILRLKPPRHVPPRVGRSRGLSISAIRKNAIDETTGTTRRTSKPVLRSR